VLQESGNEVYPFDKDRMNKIDDVRHTAAEQRQFAEAVHGKSEKYADNHKYERISHEQHFRTVHTAQNSGDKNALRDIQAQYQRKEAENFLLTGIRESGLRLMQQVTDAEKGNSHTEYSSEYRKKGGNIQGGQQGDMMPDSIVVRRAQHTDSV
jgi:hypothetical protein